jgi:hypothetical protein
MIMDFIEWLINNTDDKLNINQSNFFRMIRRYCILELNVYLGGNGMNSGNVELKKWIYPDIYAKYGD